GRGRLPYVKGWKGTGASAQRRPSVLLAAITVWLLESCAGPACSRQATINNVAMPTRFPLNESSDIVTSSRRCAIVCIIIGDKGEQNARADGSRWITFSLRCCSRTSPVRGSTRRKSADRRNKRSRGESNTPSRDKRQIEQRNSIDATRLPPAVRLLSGVSALLPPCWPERGKP